MADAAGLLSKLRDAFTKNDLAAGKALLGQIKVSLSPSMFAPSFIFFLRSQLVRAKREYYGESGVKNEWHADAHVDDMNVYMMSRMSRANAWFEQKLQKFKFHAEAWREWRDVIEWVNALRALEFSREHSSARREFARSLIVYHANSLARTITLPLLYRLFLPFSLPFTCR